MRVGFALFLLLSALAIFLLLKYHAVRPSSRVIEDSLDGATVHFSADRTVVFYPGECVSLNWHVEGIREVWLSLNPVTGQEERDWCVPARATATTPILRVKFVDDTWRQYPITVEVVEPALIYTVVPLVIAAALVLGVHRLLPVSIRRRITQPFPRARWLVEPFLSEGKVNSALVCVFLTINAIVLVNAIRHNPNVGYDIQAHLAYVDALSHLKLPTPDESYEFFSPPLPYVFPALVSRLIYRGDDRCALPDVDCAGVVKKIAQLQNVFVSLGITFYLIKLCGLIDPRNEGFKTLSLAILGMLPVYYKSLSALRGEPFVAFFTLYVLFHLLGMTSAEHQIMPGETVKLGVGAGLLILSRQWGFLVLVALVVWGLILIVRRRQQSVMLIRMGMTAGMIALVVGGWFYVLLGVQYGSVTSFNRSAEKFFSFANRPPEFYFGLGNGLLFSVPFGLSFSNQLLPKFYTEIWGDSEGVFVMSAAEPMPDYLMAYMGRVNAVSLFPTLILLLGVGFGFYHFMRYVGGKDDPPALGYSLFYLAILVSLGGYLWFLIRYPHIDGDTIKATYALHVFPLAAVLSGALLIEIRKHYHRLYLGIVFLLALVFIHNLLALFSRQTAW